MTDQPANPASLRGAVDLSALTRPAPEAGAEVSAPSLVVAGGDADFTRWIELSQTVPVLVEFYVEQATASLEQLVRSRQGQFLLVQVDAQASPQLAQAFQVRAAPTVAAVIAGRPMPLYEGELPAEDAGRVLDQVREVAAQNGVTGSLTVPEGETEQVPAAEPEPEPLSPEHQAAFDAIEAGDFDAAITAYDKALRLNPRDELATAGLAQVRLLKRLDGVDAVSLRSAAAEAPDSVAAASAVADLDVAGGHLEDAFDRLLALFPAADPDDREALRTRLLEYFELVGSDDPRVGAARRRLAALLY